MIIILRMFNVNEPTLLFKLSLLRLAFNSSKLILLSSCFCVATLQGGLQLTLLPL